MAETVELMQRSTAKKPVVVPTSVSRPLMTSVTIVPAAAALTPDPFATALRRFGVWQLRTLLVVALVKIPSAWHMASILFTAPTPAPYQYWCARPPALKHWGVEQWRSFSHPQVENTPDSCNVYHEAYEMLMEGGGFNHSLHGNATVRPCLDFEYDAPVTVVTQWHLVCGRQVLVNVSQFFYLLGVLVGGVLCAKLLLRINPRRLVLGGMMVQIGAGLGVAFSPYFELQVFLRFITAMACSSMFTAGYIICTDNTEGRWRLVVGSCYENFWSVGVITLPILSSLFQDWRHLQLAISLPTIGVLLAYRWIPDSPRWLLNAGRTLDAKALLEQALEVNGNPKVVDIFPSPVKRKPSESDYKESNVSRRHYIALHIAWAATVVTYYGALLNVKNLGDRLLLNTAIAGLAEIVGVLLGLILLLWSKHKWASLGGIKVLGGIALLLCWALPLQGYDSWRWALLAFAMVGRVAIACSLNLLTVTSGELLPPALRQRGIFSAVTFARVCLLSAPFIGSLAIFGDCVSLSVFGGLTLLGGLATLLLDSPSSEQDKPRCTVNLQTQWDSDKHTKIASSQSSLPQQPVMMDSRVSMRQSLDELV